MKVSKILVVLLISLLLFTGCSNDSDPADPDDGLDVSGEGVLVTGSFNGNTNNAVQANNTVEAADSDLQVGSIVLIKKQGYEIIEVEDNEFALDLERENPAAIAFINQNDDYLGYLNLADGMSSFPTQAVDEETDMIDLGEIEFVEDKAEPENDPVENEIELSDSEIDTLSASNSFFSAVATSPDLIELLIQDEQEIYPGISYFGSHNNFDENGDATLANVDLKLKVHRISLSFNPPLTDTHQDLTLKYPNDEVNLGTKDDEFETTAEGVNFPGVGDEDRAYKVGPVVPKSGDYTVSDNADLNFSFHIPELSVQAEEHLIVPLPKIDLYENEDGKKMLDSISWEYYTTGGEKIDNPELILKNISVQITVPPTDKKTELYGDYGIEGEPSDGGEKIFEEQASTVNNTTIDLKDQNIYWEDVYVVDMAYNDLYGIHYLVPFAHPSYNN